MQGRKWKTPYAAFILGVMTLTASCRDDTVLKPLVTHPLLSSRAPAGVRPAQIRPMEQQFDDLAQQAPSSGAYYVDESGHLVVWVRDSTDDAQARAFGNTRLASLKSARFRTAVHDVVVRRAKYTFWQLASWRDAILAHAPRNAGWSEIDMNEAVNRVDIAIDARYATQSHASLMGLIDSIGVDTNARFTPS